MVFTSVTVVTTKSLFGMCDCMVDSDVGEGSSSLMLGILYLCRNMIFVAHVSGLGLNLLL